MSRCLNCTVATNRMRRHIVITLTPQLQTILTECLSVQEVYIQLPLDGLICNACYLLLNQRGEAGTHSRVLGYPMVYISCGCSVLGRRYSVRHHTLEAKSPLIYIFFSWNTHNQDRKTNLQACHPCLMRAKPHLVLNIQRQVEELEEDEPGLPEPPPLPPVANPTVAHEPPPPPPLPDNPVQARRIDQMNYLPGYKPAPNTSSHCIFRGFNNNI